MTRTLRNDTFGGRQHVIATTAGDETRKPNLRGFKVYVGDFVAPEDPGNDPQDLGAEPPIDTSPSSPPWQNGFTYVEGAPVWFAHGLDGETDMGGAYDLITGSPVSGDVAFDMPLEWAREAQAYTAFVVLLEEGATPADDIYGMAAQIIDNTTGLVRIYWPLVATPYP